jgi:hypothetical protein
MRSLDENDEMQGVLKANEGAYFSYVTEIGFEAQRRGSRF